MKRAYKNRELKKNLFEKNGATEKSSLSGPAHGGGFFPEDKPDHLVESLLRNSTPWSPSFADAASGVENRREFPPPRNAIQVFDRDEVIKEYRRIVDDERENYKIAVDQLKKLMDGGGYRTIPELELGSLCRALKKLQDEMPNFAPVISKLQNDLALAATGPKDEFHVSCVCMNGTPGIGKTRFCHEFAKILSCGFRKISMGALSGHFELVGNSRQWGASSTGEIAKILIASETACPIVLLDEIDKINGDSRFNPVPVLLDLLEPDSAARFQDRFLEIHINASKIIFLATSNDADMIPEALKSRMHMIDILPPTVEQRFAIIKRSVRSIADQRGLTCADEEIMKLARCDVDLRESQRIVSDNIGKAIINNTREIRFEGGISQKNEPRRMGFL